MKRFLLLTTLTLVATCSRAEMKQALILHSGADTEIVYFLDTEPVISFEDQEMVITADDKSENIPMENIDYWKVGMADFSGIATPETPQLRIAVSGSEVRVYNQSCQAISVYDISGKTVGTSSAEEATFTLPRGIYIISTPNKSYKIATR